MLFYSQKENIKFHYFIIIIIIQYFFHFITFIFIILTFYFIFSKKFMCTKYSGIS